MLGPYKKQKWGLIKEVFSIRSIVFG
jgi:hypothetical protein